MGITLSSSWFDRPCCTCCKTFLWQGPGPPTQAKAISLFYFTLHGAAPSSTVGSQAAQLREVLFYAQVSHDCCYRRRRHTTTSIGGGQPNTLPLIVRPTDELGATNLAQPHRIIAICPSSQVGSRCTVVICIRFRWCDGILLRFFFGASQHRGRIWLG